MVNQPISYSVLIGYQIKTSYSPYGKPNNFLFGTYWIFSYSYPNKKLT